MAILDRPLFKKKLSKNQLRQYGIPAFANGGFIEVTPGLSQAMLGSPTALSTLVRSPEEILEQDYGSLGKFLAGERGVEAAKKKSTEEILALENALKLEAERKKKLKADAEAMRIVREKNKEQ